MGAVGTAHIWGGTGITVSSEWKWFASTHTASGRGAPSGTDPTVAAFGAIRSRTFAS